MATTQACRRRARRFLVAERRGARVEFVYPRPNGRIWDLPLVDISVSGFSFKLPEEPHGIECGESLNGVVVRARNFEIHGDLLVLHVTPRAEVVCGVLFYPASDSDLIKLRSFVAGIETAIPD